MSIIINESIKNLHIKDITSGLNDETEVIEDIDIRSLDQNHVIPNIETVSFIGIWYPSLNMQDG